MITECECYNEGRGCWSLKDFRLRPPEGPKTVLCEPPVTRQCGLCGNTVLFYGGFPLKHLRNSDVS